MVDDVLAANRAFYDAHERRDIGAMTDVWQHDDRAICVHPGWPILRTWPPIEKSWRQIFDGPARNQFIITNEAVAIGGELAWVTVDENLMHGAATSTVAATNLFAHVDGAWKLIVHHGSPIVFG